VISKLQGKSTREPLRPRTGNLAGNLAGRGGPEIGPPTSQGPKLGLPTSSINSVAPAQACSLSAQVKAAAAEVGDLNWNGEKKVLLPTMGVAKQL
jgi:hypothetical protein